MSRPKKIRLKSDLPEHVIEDIARCILPDIIAYYESGMTMKEIRDYLNSKNVKYTRGNPISYNNIEHMLKNRRYIGEARFKDTVIPNAIPAIVPQDLFDRINAVHIRYLV